MSRKYHYRSHCHNLADNIGPTGWLIVRKVRENFWILLNPLVSGFHFTWFHFISNKESVQLLAANVLFFPICSFSLSATFANIVQISALSFYSMRTYTNTYTQTENFTHSLSWYHILIKRITFHFSFYFSSFSFSPVRSRSILPEQNFDFLKYFHGLKWTIQK